MKVNNLNVEVLLGNKNLIVERGTHTVLCTDFNSDTIIELEKLMGKLDYVEYSFCEFTNQILN